MSKFFHCGLLNSGSPCNTPMLASKLFFHLSSQDPSKVIMVLYLLNLKLKIIPSRSHLLYIVFKIIIKPCQIHNIYWIEKEGWDLLYVKRWTSDTLHMFLSLLSIHCANPHCLIESMALQMASRGGWIKYIKHSLWWLSSVTGTTKNYLGREPRWGVVYTTMC